MSIEAPAALVNSDCVAEAFESISNSACSMEAKNLGQQEGEIVSSEVILAVISLMGQVDWSVFMGLSQDVAPKLAAKFAGFEIPFDSPDLADAVGELANILGGEVKARLDGRGVQADISLPSVLRGDNLKLMIPRDTPLVRYHFETPVGEVIVGVVAGRKSTLAAG